MDAAAAVVLCLRDRQMEDGIRFIRQGERFVGLRCQAEKRSLGIILHGPAACLLYTSPSPRDTR